MANELLKIDRNGSKHWRGRVECDRCGGHGYYAIGVHNGQPVLSPLDSGVCWKCRGSGWVIEEWIERTPEYQAVLDERRAERKAKKMGYASAQEMREAQDAEIARREAERIAAEEAEVARIKAEQERVAALKARSNYVGAVGEKLTATVTYEGSPYFERRSFTGYGTERCYIHRFRDADGNLLIWKTGSGFPLMGAEEGCTVVITGTVKEHSEYKDEKQTFLLRAKVKYPV